MQNKKTPLLYALICLSVTLPLLSGCRHTGGSYYKTSSWQFYNPFSSKSKNKEFDEFALAQQIDEPSGLPKQDVVAPRDGYLINSRENSRAVANSTNRTGRNTTSDPTNDLHLAGLERSSGTAGHSGNISSAQPVAADPMFAQNSSLAGPANPVNYGTTTPIEQGFGGTNMNPMAAQQPQNGVPTYGPYIPPAQPSTTQFPDYPGFSAPASDPNAGMFAGYPAHPSQGMPGPAFGQPASGQPGQPYVIPGQPFPQDSTFHPGQTGMMVQNADPSQASVAGAGVPVNNGITNPSMSASPASPQVVASTQGSGYTGQGIVAADPMFPGAMAGTLPQGNLPQGTMTQSAVPSNTTIPNAVPPTGFGHQPGMVPHGQVVDPGFGGNGFNNPAMQPAPQPTPTQQPANAGFQSGFNYFGPVSNEDYRPGGIW